MRIKLLGLMGLAVAIACFDRGTAPKPKLAPASMKLMRASSVQGDSVFQDRKEDTVVRRTDTVVALQVVDSNGDNVDRCVPAVMNFYRTDSAGNVIFNPDSGSVDENAVQINCHGQAGTYFKLGKSAGRQYFIARYADTSDFHTVLVKRIIVEAEADTAAAMQVSSSELTVSVGDTASSGIVALDQYGNVSNDTKTWQSADADIATVNSAGIVHGKNAGQTQVSASVRGLTQSVQVNVAPVYPAGAIVYARLDDADQSGLFSFATPVRGSDAEIASGKIFFPRLSPDGSKLAYVGSDSNIVVADADGNNAVNLSNSVKFMGPLSWSPTGKLLAVISADDERVYTLSASTGDTKSICGLDVGAWVDWSPDGDKFLVMSGDQIAVVDTGCTSSTVLTSLGRNIHARWSPSGEKIVFVSDRSVGEPVSTLYGAGHLFVMNADGSHQVSLWSKGAAAFPSFSPNGDYIVFSGNEGAFKWGSSGYFYERLYIVGADGSYPMKVLPEPSSSRTAYWMADWR